MDFDWLTGKTIVAVHIGLSGDRLDIAFSDGTYAEIVGEALRLENVQSSIIALPIP